MIRERISYTWDVLAFLISLIKGSQLHTVGSLVNELKDTNHRSLKSRRELPNIKRSLDKEMLSG